MNVSGKEKAALRFPLYVTKRIGFSKKAYWAIRVGGILIAFLVAGITCSILSPGSFGTFYSELVRGCFDFSDISSVIDLLITFSLLLLISIALTPAFKMKFWNIGAEGQVLMGCMAAAGVAKFSPSDWPNIAILLLAMVSAIAASTAWSVIPAIFKAYFNTNETLFTLMLNYIATVASIWAISVWIKNGSQSFGILSQGIFPTILGNSGTLVVVFSVVIFVGMFVFINFGKAGYEITVIGESVDTARYLGINVKASMIRTIAMCGSIFGLIGFFIVCGVHQSFNANIVGGNGFTGVLIAWLGHFDPLEILLFSFLSAVMHQGTTTAASAVGISSTQFSAICTGMFFFIIISCEFFTKYRVRLHHSKKKEVTKA
ncbi:MAG: ABC transporter permease [Bacilli bacterium]|nr:ABC transporter permease [Bacilli bacterium]